MPKPRKHAGSQTLFAVSPWQNKSAKREDAAKSGEIDYIVVHEDLIKKGTSATESSKANSSQQRPDQVVITNQSPATAAANVGWRTKIAQNVKADNGLSMLDSSQDLSLKPPTIATATTTAAPLGKQERRVGTTTAPSSSPSPSSSLAGTAFLVLLGGSRIVGNFTLLDNPSITYPLHGREVTSYRECTRDPEWSVVKLNLLNLPHTELPREVVIIAERTGGDAMKLKSPVEWQGDEVAAFAEELRKGQRLEIENDDYGFGGGNNIDDLESLELEFECHSLLTDAAVDGELAKVMPGAVGMDAIINIGPMRLTWKKKWK
jgi:hypothetical protein